MIMNSRKKTKAEILLIIEQLKKQQHQLQIHKDYLKKGFLQYSIITSILLGTSVFIALKYSKSRRFFSMLTHTFIVSTPRLLIKSATKSYIIPLILIEALGTAGLSFLTNKMKKG